MFRCGTTPRQLPPPGARYSKRGVREPGATLRTGRDVDNLARSETPAGRGAMFVAFGDVTAGSARGTRDSRHSAGEHRVRETRPESSTAAGGGSERAGEPT